MTSTLGPRGRGSPPDQAELRARLNRAHGVLVSIALRQSAAAIQADLLHAAKLMEICLHQEPFTAAMKSVLDKAAKSLDSAVLQMPTSVTRDIAISLARFLKRQISYVVVS